MASQNPNRGTQFILEDLTGLEQPSSLPEPEERVTQVTLETFVDNVCRQVIERHLLRPLPTMFGPESVAAYGDEDLKRIAAEAPENIMKKKEITTSLRVNGSEIDPKFGNISTTFIRAPAEAR